MAEAAGEVIQDEKKRMFTLVIRRGADLETCFKRQNSEIEFALLKPIMGND